MTDCLVYNGGGSTPPINLASPSIVTTATGSPTDVMTSLGPASYSTGGSSFQIPDHGNIAAADLSIRVLFLPVTWTGAFTALFDKGSLVANRELSVFVNTSGNISFVDVGNATGPTATTGFTVGSIWDFVMTRSSTTVSYYVNGIFLSGGAATGTTATAGFPLSFGNNISTGGTNANCQYMTAQIWNRSLTSSEIALLYFDPFCFLVAPEGEMPALFAGAPITPSLISATQSWPSLGRKLEVIGAD